MVGITEGREKIVIYLSYFYGSFLINLLEILYRTWKNYTGWIIHYSKPGIELLGLEPGIMSNFGTLLFC